MADAVSLVQRLQQHRAWVNGNLLAAASNLNDEQLRRFFQIGQGSIWKSLVHLFAAEFVWLEALLGNESAVVRGDLPGKIPGNQLGEGGFATLDELRREWAALQQRWEGYLANLSAEALDEPVSRMTSTGQRLATRRSDVLLHVCTHAHYTTAQVQNMLRQLGVEKLPEVMLIALARQEAAKKAETTTVIPSRETFENLYAGKAPWDIGKPQKPFLDVADQVKGSVLDAGCGTGDTALFFASRGNKVTGIDFLDVPIMRAKQKASDRGLTVTFLVMNALALKDIPEVFDNVIDSGLFHGFSDEHRQKYVAGLASALKPGGRLFLMCFSDEEPGNVGPRRISKKELHEAFAKGWNIESIQPVRIETRSDLEGITFSEGGPKAWFAMIRRVA